MDRRDFIKTCGFACIGGVAFGGILQSCSTTKIVSGKIEQSDLLVDVAVFELENKKAGAEKTFRKYVIVQNDALKFPICLYRFSQEAYTAIYLECTHQGAELQVFGDKIQCPAHGSEFNNRGGVENGPATEKLRTFPIQVGSQQLKISLR